LAIVGGVVDRELCRDRGSDDVVVVDVDVVVVVVVVVAVVGPAPEDEEEPDGGLETDDEGGVDAGPGTGPDLISPVRVVEFDFSAATTATVDGLCLLFSSDEAVGAETFTLAGPWIRFVFT
jgi:hypothetical protein